jgi:hypothetical protein
VKGDALFGKRTLLVRHGRLPTVVFSAVFTTVGTGVVIAVGGRPLAWASMFLALLVPVLGVLRALAVDGGHRRDENLISASAILGRAIVTVLLIHLEMTSGGRGSVESVTVGALFVVVTLGQARTMVRFGPRSTLTVPDEVLTDEEILTNRVGGTLG